MTSSPDTHRTSLQRPQKFQKALYCPQTPPNLLLKLPLGSSCGSSRISLEFSRVLKILKPSSPSHISRKTPPSPPPYHHKSACSNIDPLIPWAPAMVFASGQTPTNESHFTFSPKTCHLSASNHRTVDQSFWNKSCIEIFICHILNMKWT